MGFTRWLYSEMYRWYLLTRKSSSPRFYSLVATWFWISLNVSTLVIGTISIGFPEYEAWVNLELALVCMIVVALWVSVRLKKKLALIHQKAIEATSAQSLNIDRLKVYWIVSAVLASFVQILC